MKFLYCIGLLLNVVTSTPPIIGSWIQLYSSYFVQVTTEIDWKCVNATVLDLSVDTLMLVKHASLHGSDYYVESYPTILRVIDDYTLQDTKNITYGIHTPIPRYVIMSGLEDQALYVWMSPSYHPQDKDLEIIQQEVENMGFNNSTYTKLLESYSFESCGR